MTQILYFGIAKERPTEANQSSLSTVCTILYWIAFGLIVFSILLAYDPLGGTKYLQNSNNINNNNNNDENHESVMLKKGIKLWLRRVRLAFCCVSSDENGDEAFMQIAEVISSLFRHTDLVPSDIIAGTILMRVRQKKEYRELRRIQMLNDFCPKYSSDLTRVFGSQCPQWMNLRNAQHFLRFAVSSYGWPMICAISPCKSCCGLTRRLRCCVCFR